MDKELKKSLKELGTGIQNIREEQASFKAEVLTRLDSGDREFQEVKGDIKIIKEDIGEIKVVQGKHDVRIETCEENINTIKNQKRTDRIVSGITGGVGGLIVMIAKYLGIDYGR